MLLNDLLKLFSTQFEISEEKFVEIIASNNIRLSQRLLCNINTAKNEKQNIVRVIDNNNSIAQDEPENNLKKKETGGRGRGRPRKTKELTENSNVLVEVELIMVDGKEYYKTNENVLLNMDMEIQGIYQSGRILRHGLN